MIGKTLGPYQVIEKLGEGGMGEVYRARDTKLDRDVAIKILPEAFALDRERVARFDREAKTLAALNHPHIAQIHGFHEANGTHALVMELVEGDTLAERIAAGSLPVHDALHVARQIADALDASHEKGIIHRDLKPANIKLTPDGVVKVLDFGLAKAVDPAGSNSVRTETPTITSPAVTHAGVILGTAAYMSPEQARGKAVDKRADIWAFGCVLCEMLAGRPAFQGETVSELLAAVMRDTPPLDALPRSIGWGPRQLIARCLQKDPKDRLRDIGDARWYLDEQAAQPDGIARAPRHTWRERLALPLAAFAAIAVGAALWGWLRPIPPLQALRRVVVPTPELSRITSAALAPTGDRVAFVGDGRLWIQLLAERTARSIPNSDGASHPFWSPDGGRVGYFVGTRVFTVGVDGGAPMPLTELDRGCRVGFPCAGAWTDDGRILLTSSFGNVIAVSDHGGAPAPYLTAGDGEHFHEVSALPGDRGALVTVDPDEGVEHVIVWDGRERRTLLSPAERAVYSPSGHVIVSRGESLWAVPFSLSTMETTGEPFLISEAAGEASVSRDGALLYTAQGRREQQLVWVDRSGAIRETVGTHEGSAFNADVSPDGRRIAFVSAAAGQPQIWILEPARGMRTPLVREPFVQLDPVWSADGASVFYVGHPPGQLDAEHRAIRTARPGSATSSVVVERGHGPSVSLDGRHLVFSVGDIGRSTLHHLALEHVMERPKAFSSLGISGGSARLSPDGRFVAYMQDDPTGRFEIYLSSFPKRSAEAQVSRGGFSYRTAIRWSATGDRLYYVRTSDGALVEVDVRLEPSVRLAEPRPLFVESTTQVNLDRGFAVSPDGSRFLVVREWVPHGEQSGGLVLVQNWIDEFRR